MDPLLYTTNQQQEGNNHIAAETLQFASNDSAAGVDHHDFSLSSDEDDGAWNNSGFVGITGSTSLLSSRPEQPMPFEAHNNNKVVIHETKPLLLKNPHKPLEAGISPTSTTALSLPQKELQASFEQQAHMTTTTTTSSVPTNRSGGGAAGPPVVLRSDNQLVGSSVVTATTAASSTQLPLGGEDPEASPLSSSSMVDLQQHPGTTNGPPSVPPVPDPVTSSTSTNGSGNALPDPVSSTALTVRTSSTDLIPLDSTALTTTTTTNAAPETSTALTTTTTTSPSIATALTELPLYDRDKELDLLRQEYASMLKRAAAPGATGLRHRNLTSVICIAGKAGTGKTSLVRALMEAETKAAAAAAAEEQDTVTSPVARAETDRSPYFVLGKFVWPTTSVTSSLKARPHVPNSASMAAELANNTNNNNTNGNNNSSTTTTLTTTTTTTTAAASADTTHYQPALAQSVHPEQDQQHEPYSAFVLALEHLLEQIEAKGPTVTDKLRSRILQAIGGPSSIPVLGELSPKFATFLQQPPLDPANQVPEEVTTTTSAVVGGGTEGGGGTNPYGRPKPRPSTTESTFQAIPTAAKNIRVEHRVPRLKYVLRQLFRGLCHHNRNPCVLVLDDAQWADPESLELARYLHSDLENPLFLLILTWRTNDIHEEESCYTAMGSSIGIFANDLVRRINLQNLSHDSVSELLARVVDRPVNDVKILSKVVHHKTSGNPLFVRLFLEYLEKELYLKWRAPRQIWAWDELRIADLNISHNFLGLIVAKILRLPMSTRVVLQILACLGQAFEPESACTIIDKIDTVELFDVALSHLDAATCIDALVRDGFLNRTSPSATLSSFSLRTTFTHDQIQEAAFQLIPKHSRQLLQLRIGERLLELMEEQRSEYVSFLGIDLCSKGIGFLSSKERMGLALYNLLAGEKCLSRASFSTALAYFEFGLTCLRISDFLKGRLSLELSFGAMEAAFGVDDFDKVRLHYDRITGSGTTPEDNLRAHVLLIRATGTRGYTKEALDTGFSVLRSLGVKTVVDMSNKVSLLIHMTKTKMTLRKQTEDSLAQLPEMSSTKFRHGMSVVEAMMPFAYEYDQRLFMCLTMKIVRWSIKYGVTSQTPLVFAALGSSPTFQSKDMRLASALGNAALRLMERFGTRENAGMIRFVVNSQIRSWTVEPQVVHRSLESTYRSSLGSGDLLPAFCSLAAAYAVSFDCGQKRLDEMESLGGTYSLEIQQGSSPVIAGIHDATWQLVLNLRSDARDVRSETAPGLSMTKDEALSYGNDFLEFAFLSRDLQLTYFLGEHKRAEDIRKRSEVAIKNITSSPHLILHNAYCALNCLMLCASGSEPVRKNAHYKAAVQHVAKLNHWIKDYGYRFGGHLIKLIQAEFSRVEGRYTLAEKNYQGSVWVAGRQGNHRDKGLAHELAGRFFIRDRKDETWAAYHFDQAVQAYHSWGATLLVNRLLEKYGDVVSRDPARSEVSSHLLSVQTHDSSVV